MDSPLDSYLFWQRVLFWVQILVVLLYAASVAAFLLGLKRRLWRVPTYFSGLFFLALCPFFILFSAAVWRLSHVFYHIDGVANAQEILSYGVQPLYLGVATSSVLVALYSTLFAWQRPHRVA